MRGPWLLLVRYVSCSCPSCCALRYLVRVYGRWAALETEIIWKGLTDTNDTADICIMGIGPVECARGGPCKDWWESGFEKVVDKRPVFSTDRRNGSSLCDGGGPLYEECAMSVASVIEHSSTWDVSTSVVPCETGGGESYTSHVWLYLTELVVAAMRESLWVPKDVDR